jgi:hypothetical protein
LGFARKVEPSNTTQQGNVGGTMLGENVCIIKVLHISGKTISFSSACDEKINA